MLVMLMFTSSEAAKVNIDHTRRCALWYHEHHCEVQYCCEGNDAIFICHFCESQSCRLCIRGQGVYYIGTNEVAICVRCYNAGRMATSPQRITTRPWPEHEEWVRTARQRLTPHPPWDEGPVGICQVRLPECRNGRAIRRCEDCRLRGCFICVLVCGQIRGPSRLFCNRCIHNPNGMQRRLDDMADNIARRLNAERAAAEGRDEDQYIEDLSWNAEQNSSTDPEMPALGGNSN